jgi:hypothetical protein
MSDLKDVVLETAKELVAEFWDCIYTRNAHNADEDADNNCALLSLTNERATIERLLDMCDHSGYRTQLGMELARIDQLITKIKTL